MDGFESSEAVVVLAATNRPEILDAALLRPGRFDRRVAVPSPDRHGRARILEVHTRSIPLAPDVDLDALASSTPGMVGSDLANLCNEAALLATRLDHEQVQMRDFTDSLEMILLDTRRGIVLSPLDREHTAFHESGHALVADAHPRRDPVRKISIIPRGMALGVTLSVPDDDRVSYTREDLLARIEVALGGRVAEELVYATVTTGAESDLQQLTQVARSMVGRWGMSDAVGLATVLPAEGHGPLLPGARETSEATQRLVDEEVPPPARRRPRRGRRAPHRAPRIARESQQGPARQRDARRARRLRRGRRPALGGISGRAPVGLGLVLRRTARSHRGCRA